MQTATSGEKQASVCKGTHTIPSIYRHKNPVLALCHPLRFTKRPTDNTCFIQNRKGGGCSPSGLGHTSPWNPGVGCIPHHPQVT